MSRVHPSDVEWADFARELLPRAQAERLRVHFLRCSSCRRTCERFAALAALGRREEAYAPPEPVFARAKALFTSAPARRRDRWSSLAGILQFDSWLEPALAGVRSRGLGERHVTYRAGEWEIDLRLEPTPPRALAVLGQVAHSSDEHVRLGGVPVTLLAGRRPVATTTLNAFGEFQIDCGATTGNLRLRIPMPAYEVRLDIPIPRTPPAGKTTHVTRRTRR